MSNSVRIYAYDNATGLDIPEKIGIFPVELLLGSSINAIHKNILECQLFCVFTPIADADIIVQTEQDAEMMRTTLNFGKRSYTVGVKENSIWYSDKAYKNIIISNTVHLPASEMGSLILLYINELAVAKRAEYRKPVEMYSVVNVRNENVLLKTPNYNEAITLCNKNPCCVIRNKAGEDVYKSSYGKAAVPYKKNNHTAKHKVRQDGHNGVFNITAK